MDSAAHRLLDVQRIVAATDAWVFRPVAGRGRGYADNTPGWCRTAAFELTRGGWAQLVQVLLEQPARGTALQIGLGRFGGSHFALGQLFDRVLTVEIDAERVEAFRAANPERSGRDQFVVGDATLRQTFEEVRRHAASVDFLLLDGGDTYGQMAASWRRFAGLVAPGGMVAVVDSSQRFQEVRDRIGVDRFIADLTAVLRSCGIALACTRANPQVHYYRVTEQAHTALAATLRHEPSDGGRDAPELLQPDHLGWATYAHRGFVAVRADSPAFEPRQVFRGERAELLWAPSLAALQQRIAGYRVAAPALDRAGDELCDGRLDAARRHCDAALAACPDLYALLVDAINHCPFGDLLLIRQAILCALTEHRREATFLLQRAAELDRRSPRMIALRVAVLRFLDGDEPAALAVLRNAHRELRRDQLQTIALLEFPPGPVRNHAGSFADAPGILQYATGDREDLPILARLGVRRALFVEPEPATIDALVAAAAHTQDAPECRFALLDAARPPLDSLLQQGLFDPADYGFVYLRLNADLPALLRGSRATLLRSRYVSIATAPALAADARAVLDEAGAFLRSLGMVLPDERDGVTAEQIERMTTAEIERGGVLFCRP